jgi:hypothetical protein
VARHPRAEEISPDLRIHTIAASPTGLVRGARPRPASRVIAENYDAIVKEFPRARLHALEPTRTMFLNVFPNDWERIKEILR